MQVNASIISLFLDRLIGGDERARVTSALGIPEPKSIRKRKNYGVRVALRRRNFLGCPGSIAWEKALTIVLGTVEGVAVGVNTTSFQGPFKL